MEPITSQSETMSTKPESYTAKRIVGVIFGVIEIILGFRFVFKLMGANPNNGFVKVIYNITQFFVGIFNGIFPQAKNAAFEPGTLIAIIVIALLAWIVLKLMTPRKSNLVERTEFTSTSPKPESTVVNPAWQQQQQAPPPQQQQAPPPQQQQQAPPPQQVPQQAPQQVPQQAPQQPQDSSGPWTDANQQNRS